MILLLIHLILLSCCSVIKLCPTLCNPMGCSMPGFPVLHYLWVYSNSCLWVSDIIQPSHPLSSPSPPTFNLSQHQGLFQWLCCLHQFSSVQSLSCVWLFVTPWTTACQASLSITNSRSLPKPMSIESVMPSNHLILCCPLLLQSLICPSIGVFSKESALHIRWPKYWNFSFNINLSNEYSGLISFRMDWSKGPSRVFSNITVTPASQKH